MFIARISRGRTFRQFVTGVLLVPPLVTVIWFSIFGGTACNIQLNAVESGGASGSMVTMVDGVPSVDFQGALFDLIKHLGSTPGVTLAIALLAMVLIGIFFVTGADSASIVMGSLSTNGRMEPSKRVMVFWGVLTGAVAAIMLLAGGDDPGAALTSLKNITIISALPYAIVMFILCFALVRDLRRDPLAIRKKFADSVVERAIRTAVDEHGEGHLPAGRCPCALVQQAEPSGVVPMRTRCRSRARRTQRSRNRGRGFAELSGPSPGQSRRGWCPGLLWWGRWYRPRHGSLQ